MESALGQFCAAGKARRILHILKIHRYAVLIVSVACTLASSGCSSDGTQAAREETVNFVAGTEHEKPTNPRVHPGRPYTQEVWLDL
ncbi:MAG: hypothetical protein JOZ08_26330 [Verrucomicrobia bacterium]|nr:hypothetical protein [Verrucomicrobiota bacterium]